MKPSDNFCVLMCVYEKDDPALFHSAIESVYANTVIPKQFILVIDGPIPAALEKAVNFLKEKYPITIQRLDKNLGLASALNFGLRFIDAEWIARADADDINSEYRFEKQLKFARAGYDLVGSSIYEVDSSHNIIAHKKMPTSLDAIKKYIRFRNPFNHMTIFLRSGLVAQLGGYPNIYLKEDYAFWAKLIQGGASAVNLDDPLVIASSGRAMYKRRGGLKSAISEIQLQIYLIKYGATNILFAIFCGGARLVTLLMPPSILGFFYQKFLR